MLNFIGQWLFWNAHPYQQWYRTTSALGFFVGWIPHALWEGQLDIRGPRSVAHMRYKAKPPNEPIYYGPTTQLNSVQSFLFGVASALQASALTVPFGYSPYVHIIAATVFLASSFVTILAGRVCCCQRCGNNGSASNSGCPNQLDLWSNFIYLLGSLVLWFGAIDLAMNPDQFLGPFLQYMSSILWLATGFLYVFADIWRWRKNTSRGDTSRDINSNLSV